MQPHQPVVWSFIYSQLSACPVEMEPFKNHYEQSWMSDKTQKHATAKVAWAAFSTDLPEMLGSVYSYCVMVKGVSCCCVHGRRLFSNPITYISYLYYTKEVIIVMQSSNVWYMNLWSFGGLNNNLKLIIYMWINCINYCVIVVVWSIDEFCCYTVPFHYMTSIS